MSIALRKRSIEPGRIERAITGIIRRIESSGQTEIKSQQVGELVMDALSQLDQVAYIRYASVYRNFREAQDFEDFVESLNVPGEEEIE
jgi:transcriptional repressor NrdR